MIENTSGRDPLIHLAGSMDSQGLGGYIEEMESAGQAQLINSTVLPAKVNGGSEADLAEIGVTLGPIDPNDQMFRQATLPEGWAKQPTDHSMWSKVVDQHGRQRIRIFYKAAFYDRDAFMSVVTIYGYVNDLVDGRSPLHLDDWATAEALRAAVKEARAQCVESRDRGDTDGYWSTRIAECDSLLAYIAEKASA